jgi:hypothetical protein
VGIPRGGQARGAQRRTGVSAGPPPPSIPTGPSPLPAPGVVSLVLALPAQPLSSSRSPPATDCRRRRRLSSSRPSRRPRPRARRPPSASRPASPLTAARWGLDEEAAGVGDGPLVLLARGSWQGGAFRVAGTVHATVSSGGSRRIMQETGRACACVCDEVFCFPRVQNAINYRRYHSGGLDQLADRSLRMREVRGSKPRFSIFLLSRSSSS